MQRVLAFLLLSVIGILPICSPLADATISTRLPACCRALGKHHCAMRSSGQTPGLGSDAEHCPFAPTISSAAVPVFGFSVPDSEPFFQPIVNRLAGGAQATVLYHIAFDRNAQKRGPPVLFS